MILQNFLQNELRDVRLSNIELNIRLSKEILQSGNFLYNKLRNIKHCFVYSARNFAKSLFSLMSQKFEKQDCQWYEVKRIKSIFSRKGNSGKKVWSTSLLPQVIFIFSIKPDLKQYLLAAWPKG